MGLGAPRALCGFLLLCIAHVDAQCQAGFFPATGINLARECALGACSVTAKSPGIYGSYFPWYAVDGGTWSYLTPYFSANNDNEWIMVDMEQTRSISFVKGFGGYNTFGNSDGNYEIRLGSSSTLSSNTVCFSEMVLSTSFIRTTNLISRSFTCSGSGRYLSFQQKNNRYFDMIELEIYGEGCTGCAQGKYKPLSGSQSCTSCLANSGHSLTAQTSATACTCNAGYTGPNGGTCTACGANTYKSTRGSASCGACPANQVSETAAITCLCNVGYTGPNLGTCTACVAGKYKAVTGADSCTDCSLNTYSAAVGATAASTCTACPTNAVTSAIGQTAISACLCNVGYSGPNGGTCTACIAGKYKIATGSAACIDCSLNTYSAAVGATLASTCTACPANAGTSATGQTAISACLCNVGYSGPNGGTCTACVAGKYKTVSGTASCTDCSLNTYSAAVGATAASTCTACPANAVTSAAGQTAISACLCNVGYSGPDGGTCTACIAGKYKTVTGTASCTDCSLNTYSAAVGATAASTCTACPANAVTSAAGQTAISACLCNVGYSGPDGGTCTACIAGKYKIATGSAACIDCSLNTYSAAVGAIAASTCTACPANTVTSATGQTAISACLCNLGFTGPGGGPCVACGAGKYSTTVGASVASTCTDCGAGKYSTATGAATSDTCLSCPNNTQAMPGSDAVTDCVCNAGYRGRRIIIISNTFCQSYIQDTYIYFQHWEDRPAYRSIDMTKFIFFYPSKSHWIIGPTPGVDSAWAYISSNAEDPSNIVLWNEWCGSTWSNKTSLMLQWYDNHTTCIICEAGKYSAANASICTNCGVNTYSTTTGATEASTCVACNSNSQSVSGSTAATSCVCNPGFTGLNGALCTACPAGAYKPDVGAAACSACPVNSLSLAGSTAISACLCNAGYETSFDGSGVILACSACPTGKYKATAGSASGCRLCESDLPFSTGAFDSASPSCVCRPGYVLDAGACRACQKGTYKENQGNSTLDCASLLGGCCACGQFQTTTSAGSAVALTDCVCLHGHGVADPNNFACMPCPRGTYKEGTDRQACAACPAGMSTSEVGAFEQRECVSRAGYFMVFDAGGLGTAHACANGTYSDYMNATACKPCFTGATSPAASESIDACACESPFAPSGEPHDCTCGAGFALA